MYKFNFAGKNRGYFNSNPGEVKEVNCDTCGTKMNVERNVLGATNYIEAVLKKKHLHDSFICPNLTRVWHIEIFNLKRKTNDRLISAVHKSGWSLDYIKNYVKSKEFVEYEKKLVIELNRKVKKIFKAAQKKH